MIKKARKGEKARSKRKKKARRRKERSSKWKGDLKTQVPQRASKGNVEYLQQEG
jgi:hypothetical protein